MASRRTCRTGKTGEEARARSEATKRCECTGISDAYFARRSVGMLFDVCLRTVNVLAAFADGNKDNQKILFDKLDLFESKMSRGFNIWDVIITIFDNNVDLVEKCPQDLIVRFAALLENTDYSCRHLDFFLNLVEPVREYNSRTIVRNQNLVAKALTDKTYTKTLILKDPAKQQGAPGSGTRVTDKQLINEQDFFEKSLRVLSQCAKGKNSLGGSKSQALVSLQYLSHILAANAKKKDSGPLSTTIMEFTNNVFVETPLRDSQLAESKDMWGILVIAAKLTAETWKEIQADLINAKLRTEDFERIIACVELLKNFFETTYNKEVTSKRIEKASEVIDAR